MKCVLTLVIIWMTLSLLSSIPSYGKTEVALYSYHKETPLFWPTPNPAFTQNKPLEDFVQPASSGKIQSGLFGCVRNDGARFHEGLDLKPINRDRYREATDPIYAFMAGKVAFINAIPGNSNYGRYIVIEHLEATPPLYSLYAHLASIDSQIKQGLWVDGKTVLGKMGRSANHPIPQTRAHLHFEVGFRLSDDFSSWWRSQYSKKQNRFGNYHGWNLISVDPLDLFRKWRSGSVQSLQDYIEQLPTAYTLRVRTSKIPFFIKQYPSLLSQKIPYETIQGWEIDYTSYGLPKQWTPLQKDDILFLKTPGEVTVVYYDAVLDSKSACRSMIKKDGKTGELTLSKTVRSHLQILFGFR